MKSWVMLRWWSNGENGNNEHNGHIDNDNNNMVLIRIMIVLVIITFYGVFILWLCVMVNSWSAITPDTDDHDATETNDTVATMQAITTNIMIILVATVKMILMTTSVFLLHIWFCFSLLTVHSTMKLPAISYEPYLAYIENCIIWLYLYWWSWWQYSKVMCKYKRLKSLLHGSVKLHKSITMHRLNYLATIGKRWQPFTYSN